MARVIDLYIDQGSDFTATFPPVTDVDGNAMDLTTYTASCQIRQSYATIYAVQLTVDSTEFPEGIITITLPNNETSGLTPTRYVYDIVITDTDGIITKVFEGLATVNPGVSGQPNTILLTPYVPEDYGGLD